MAYSLSFMLVLRGCIYQFFCLVGILGDFFWLTSAFSEMTYRSCCPDGCCYLVFGLLSTIPSDSTIAKAILSLLDMIFDVNWLRTPVLKALKAVFGFLFLTLVFLPDCKEAPRTSQLLGGQDDLGQEYFCHLIQRGDGPRR